MQNIEAIWCAADAAQSRSHKRYPDLGCLSGCADCCRSHGSPLTYALEWQAISTWLNAHSEVRERARTRLRNIRKHWRQRLLSAEKPRLSEALFEVSCPFLEEGRCTIYPVRPTTCRAFGNTLLEKPATSGDAVYTCNREKDRWETLLPQSDIVLAERTPLFADLEASGPPLSLIRYLAQDDI